MAIRKIPCDTEYFHYHNQNPKNKRSSDCVVRAISTASDKSWDEVLDDLVIIAHKYKEMPNDTKCYSRYLEDLGFIKCKQPRHTDNTKYTGKEFIKWCNKNLGSRRSIVAHIGGNHVIAIKELIEIDGDGHQRRYDYNIYDIWNSSNGTIGNYWIK